MLLLLKWDVEVNTMLQISLGILYILLRFCSFSSIFLVCISSYRHPVVCGITLLDKDHLKSLGGTVESIAWHKSGIFKVL